jgi:hypothetical protein
MKNIYIETAEVMPYAEGNRLRVIYRTSEQGEMEATSERKEWFGEVILKGWEGESLTMGVNDDLTPNHHEIVEILEILEQEEGGDDE